jgi:hypothetical protein
VLLAGGRHGRDRPPSPRRTADSDALSAEERKRLDQLLDTKTDD